MKEWIQDDKSPIEPVYWMTEPNESISLGEVAVQFDYQGEKHDLMAKVKMRFLPKARLSFTVTTTSCQSPLPGLAESDMDGTLTIKDTNVTLDVSCVSSKLSSGIPDITMVLVPLTSGVTVTMPTANIAAAKFHLFNFPDFVGNEDYTFCYGSPTQRGWRRCGRVVLRSDGWAITIVATGATKEVCETLKEKGGWVITHVGKIERQDSSTFSTQELKDILHCLHYFLSFALGQWAGLAFPVGYDSTGTRVFEEWGLRLASQGAWSSSCSWFDARCGDLLTQVFPGFAKLWKDDLWHATLSSALYWYIRAGGDGGTIDLDGGLVLAQAALERLAWTYCVQYRKMVSAQAFERRGLIAADKLRMLVSSLDIPLEIPDALKALHAKRGQKWGDSMDAITKIRNNIIHPADKEQQLPEQATLEAWKLSLWYIDMILLRLCGHHGECANRLTPHWTGQVELVPWASKMKNK
jgi:hypothetical protein